MDLQYGGQEGSGYWSPVSRLFSLCLLQADELGTWTKPIHLIGGTYDDIAPAEDIVEFYKKLPVVEKSIKILATNHFYAGKDEEIVEFIGEVIEPAQATTR
jgi:hypothetical protein